MELEVKEIPKSCYD